MAVNSFDNMIWMAEHIHCFEFHTLQALEFKAQLQHWWRSAIADRDQASDLLEKYLFLCQATPVEAASGWYWDSSMNPSVVSDIRTFTDTLPPRADITSSCPESCFVPKFNCFFALLTPAQRSTFDENLLMDHRSAMLLAMDNLKDTMSHTMQDYKTQQFWAIYTKHRNFTLLKGLFHLILFGFALLLCPFWLECVTAILRTLSRYGTDALPMLSRLRLCAPSYNYLGFTEILLVTVLVPAVLLDMGQTFCEFWFSIYRIIARVILRIREKRATRVLNSMIAAASRNTAKMKLSAGHWHRSEKALAADVVFRMPSWVQVGDNPLFQKKLFPRPFRNIFRVYPQTPPSGRSWRSRPLIPMVIRIAIAFFFVVITFNF